VIKISRTMLLAIFLVLTIFLVGCAESGSKFVGKWKDKSGRHSMEIIKDNNVFVVKIARNQIPFSLQENGILTGPYNSSLRYVSNNDSIILTEPVLFKGMKSTEYNRIK
jgi:hypothetical protein